LRERKGNKGKSGKEGKKNDEDELPNRDVHKSLPPNETS
jgi:hypothetical protein